MIELKKRDGIVFLQSDLLMSKHAFSTRIGGVSTLAHTSSLNLAFGRGDDDETVLENIRLFLGAVGIDGESIISVPQIHSADVKDVGGLEKGYGVHKTSPFSCDGYVTREQGISLGVKTADCVPILMEARDEQDGVIAVSAIHAGWRGTVSKIAKVGVEKLISLGAKRDKIFVAIGPCIHRCCYEVGEDLCREVKEKLGQNYYNESIITSNNGKLYADLTGMNLRLLLSCGISEENIDASGYCTCCNPDLFYSHRASNGVRGTMMSVIQM